jgi:HD-like signal output (HDOD) protein
VPDVPRRILFVDDEQQLLDGLKKALRPWRAAWQVDLALGGKAACEAIDRTPYEAIVSDARMPEVDGEAVLNYALAHQPQAVRLVLSGQVDAKTGHRLASVAHQFLAKPSPAAAIIAAVEDTCRMRDALTDSRLRAVVSAMGALPVSPATYHRITDIVDSPTASLDEVATLLSENVAISATLLRLVSSAYFGLPRKVTSVREAVSFLGLEAVREAVLLVEVFREPDALGLLDEVQRRGLLRSRLARLIAEGSPMTALAAEAALLADLGIYVLALRMPDAYRAVWARHVHERIALSPLEQEAFGTTHERVGASLLGLWNIPGTVVTAVGYSRQMPDPGSVTDTRTVLALARMLEDEALGFPPLAPGCTEQLAGQLGVQARLPLLREWSRSQWGAPSA